MAPPSVESSPAETLCRDLLEQARSLEASGQLEAARELRARVESFAVEHRRWLGGLQELLSTHHEINNALVGVSGNVQLLLMGPMAQGPARERLEVILREAGRIREAALRLRELKLALSGGGASARAA